jgi:hypothetical protein
MTVDFKGDLATVRFTAITIYGDVGMLKEVNDVTSEQATKLVEDLFGSFAPPSEYPRGITVFRVENLNNDWKTLLGLAVGLLTFKPQRLILIMLFK